ncbi:hypothetical protein J4573_42905 [Actinomadura barringtoniae]|uniref:Uncharacterized protein n=1 Tax=Actinomadura barringtoniae TaxID=1427535 RepID=A0A939PSD7_9ACTN|nr:hypothetical protein [Actinomadura barringtoniae]MBO2453901.1 hypothetical protein [Actinomadura barringtoniae]
MRHKMPDLSTTQLIASGLATLAAAWGASYLGVYGTILGAAFMSVASTAGAAVCKHYLDQGKEQLHERTHLQEAVQEEAVARGAAAAATSADPTRTARWLGDANATQFMDDPNATRVDPNATRMDGLPTLSDPNVTRIDRTPAETVAAELAAEAGDEAVRRASWKAAFESTLEWARQRWVVLLVSSAAVFAVVTGGVALFQWQTDKAFGGSGVIQQSSRGGGGGGGTDHDEKPSHKPSTGTSSPTPSDSGSAPSDTPSSGPSSSPSDKPTETPTTPTAPPTNPTPTPDKSTPKDTPSTGDGQGGQTPKNNVQPSGN